MSLLQIPKPNDGEEATFPFAVTIAIRTAAVTS